jgi:hypothetical protein
MTSEGPAEVELAETNAPHPISEALEAWEGVSDKQQMATAK